MSIPESLEAHIAVVDGDGVIVDVNERWKRFGAENGLGEPFHCVGVNYLELCQSTLGSEHRLSIDLSALLLGKTSLVTWIYPCHSADGKRWFSLIGVPRSDVPGAVLAHIDLQSLVTEAGWQDGPVVETSRAALSPRTKPITIGGRKKKESTSGNIAQLSQRQAKVLVLLLEGMTNPQIASKLGISASVVKKHVSVLLSRFDVGSRRELIRRLKGGTGA